MFTTKMVLVRPLLHHVTPPPASLHGLSASLFHHRQLRCMCYQHDTDWQRWHEHSVINKASIGVLCATGALGGVLRPHLHVAADTEQQAEVHAQRPDVGARLARHPEHSQVPLLVVPTSAA